MQWARLQNFPSESKMAVEWKKAQLIFQTRYRYFVALPGRQTYMLVADLVRLLAAVEIGQPRLLLLYHSSTYLCMLCRNRDAVEITCSFPPLLLYNVEIMSAALA